MDTILVLGVLVIIQAILLIALKFGRTTAAHELALLAFSYTVILIVTITGVTPLSGFHADIRPEEINLTPFVHLVPWQAVGNVLLFVPFGLLLPLVFARYRFFGTVLSGFLFSLFIETAQLFLSRCTDVDDLIMNTLGAALGYAVYRLVYHFWPGFCGRAGNARGYLVVPVLLVVSAVTCRVILSFYQIFTVIIV